MLTFVAPELRTVFVFADLLLQEGTFREFLESTKSDTGVEGKSGIKKKILNFFKSLMCRKNQGKNQSLPL